MQSFVPWAVGLHTLVQQGRGGCRGSCGDLLGFGVRGRASGGEQTQGCPGGCGGWGAAVRRGQQHFALGLLGLAWHSSVGHGMAWHSSGWHGTAQHTPKSHQGNAQSLVPTFQARSGEHWAGERREIGGGTRGNVTAAEGQGALCGNSARGKLPPGTLTPAPGPAGVKRLLERGQEQKTNLLFFGNYEVTNDQ